MRFTREELESLERSLYDDETWAELQRRRTAEPDKIHYIRRTCIYKELGVADPIGEACPDCKE